MKTGFYTKSFGNLTVAELYDLLALRATVFVHEQNCVYVDPDGQDKAAHHVLCYRDDELIATCRLLSPGVVYREPSIGRVVVARQARGSGIGRDLMRFAITESSRLFGETDILISAQCYLEKFYSDLGFSAEGESYLEDGIPHIKMRLTAAS